MFIAHLSKWVPRSDLSWHLAQEQLKNQFLAMSSLRAGPPVSRPATGLSRQLGILFQLGFFSHTCDGLAVFPSTGNENNSAKAYYSHFLFLPDRATFLLPV
jgi:hypothetical protein